MAKGKRGGRDDDGGGGGGDGGGGRGGGGGGDKPRRKQLKMGDGQEVHEEFEVPLQPREQVTALRNLRSAACTPPFPPYYHFNAEGTPSGDSGRGG